jgi:very-short-patch-repair endonuclease/Cdc6-like AAA superfamily ATPase
MLVQRLWQDGQFFDDKSEIREPDGPYIYRQPMLLLGRSNQGLAEALDRYVDALPDYEELPESLLRIVGLETGREEEAGEHEPGSIDLLLTNDANPEQELVIHRLEETGAVLVQGPPGTGKTHTIANLIGHLLAQKKSVLVTSHTSKALRVVRDKVAKPLQSLCVSVFYGDEESSKQLEESITGIVNYISTTSTRKLTRDIEQLHEKREELKKQHEELRHTLLNAMGDEYRDLEVMGETFAPAAAAKKLVEQKGAHDWIPGPVVPDAEIPLTPQELRDLYTLNSKVTAADEAMLTASLPELEKLPTPKQFAGLFDDINQLERKRLKAGSEYWLHERQTPELLEKLQETVNSASEVLQTDEDWLLECVDAGREGQGEKESWRALVQLIEECCAAIPEKEELVLTHGPKIKPDTDAQDLARICTEILNHLKAGKKLKKLSTMLKPEWQTLIDSCSVDDGPPSRREHFQAILHCLEIRGMRDALCRRWDRQMDSLQSPKSNELGRKPEKTARQYSDKIMLALNWHDEAWSKCEEAFDVCGIDWKRLANKVPLQQSSHGETLRVRDVLLNQVPQLLETRKEYLSWQHAHDQRDQWLTYVTNFAKKDAAADLIKLFKHGIKKPHYDVYVEAWTRLQQLTELRPLHTCRRQLIAQLESVAVAWADALRKREHPHDQGTLPGDAKLAWKYRQVDQKLDKIAETDLDTLGNQLANVRNQLHEVSAEYVEKLAWLAQLDRTGLKQQQALNGWLALHKKMGKGTGKHVGRLREEARKTLAECRNAVPVWIMPLSRVIESFDVATTKFDVVIIDEASQSDVLGLIALAMAKEVAVVGDHEQVSPYAVGYQTDVIHGLIDEMLEDIPNKQLYDGRTSVYDLARQSFGGTIRLLEHFRCVPDIIQFSNHLCYNGEIRALREVSAAKVQPHLVCHRVKGTKAPNKVNEVEAQEVAALVAAMCRLSEYDDCTIGVVSMVGTEQALYIDSILRRRLSVSEYQKRRLLCGNASQFQGDERDVMVLSLVDSPSNRPLPRRQREDAMKVFNVAASRARDQLWVVHSLAPERDLKHGDLRLKLISHAMDPKGLRKEVIEPPGGFASEFEEVVYKGLTEAGYRVVLRCQVGTYVVDLVVEGESKRVAIQCDGDRKQLEEELPDLMHRQLTLERLGWNFIRLRSSEFFRDTETGLKKLCGRLKDAGIEALGPVVTEAPDTEKPEALKEKVLKRAEMIRTRWQDIPAPPEAKGVQADAEDEAGDEEDEESREAA